MTQGFTNQQTYAVLPPTVQKFTSGSGTYTLPSGAKYIVVQMAGAGGGGAGSSDDGSGGAGGTGGTTTFGSSLLTCTGGTGGTGGNPASGGAGGSATLNSPAYGMSFAGQAGGAAAARPALGINELSGLGGSTFFGGGGNYVTSSAAAVAGNAATANTGSGGGGAANGNGAAAAFCGGGGGSGGYLTAFIASPSATYSYSIGAAGTAGTAGNNGAAGGAGAAGVIIVTEYYDTIGIPSNLTLPVPVNQGGTGVTNNNWTAGSLTFSPTTQGIVGTTTNDSAGAGYVGEFVSANRAYTSPLALTNNTITNLTSISLSAGDWDVYGNVINNNSNDYIQYLNVWTNTVSVTLPSEVNNAGLTLFGSAGGNTVRSTQFSTIAPYQRYSLSTTTTIYLIAQTASNAGTNNCSGSIYARRVR